MITVHEVSVPGQ